MNSFVLIETTNHSSSQVGIKTAKNFGYYIHLITSRKNIVKQEFPEIDEIHLINDLEEEIIHQKIKEINHIHNINIIISFLDPFVSVAAKFHNMYCHKNISGEAFRIMEDKILTRNHLQYKPYSPYFFSINTHESVKNLLPLIKQKYPLILKSPLSTGSKDVYLIHTENQMKNRINFLKRKNSNKDLLIEEYINGPQWIVEAIVYQGNIQIVAIIEQQLTKHLKFIVTGYSISSDLDENMFNSISKVTHSILNDLDVQNGNCHLELRFVNGAWKLIEINPRISGGAMNRIIYEAYGFNYIEQILRLYQGVQPLIERKYEHCIYSHFFTVDMIGELKEVTGVEEAKKFPGILEVFIKPKIGHILSPPLSMGHRYGYIIAKGKTKKEAKVNALQASEQIKFHLSPI
ncbi:MAG TPA: ATP-grasp domain-containing protein [Pseudoneobacillus sp.]|nr:ATP-grasp domain-containing protein [Pseudoneobacillus sp.]